MEVPSLVDPAKVPEVQEIFHLGGMDPDLVFHQATVLSFSVCSWFSGPKFLATVASGPLEVSYLVPHSFGA